MNRSVFAISGIVMICLVFNCTAALGGDRFTDNGDGTVTDHERNLMWSKTDNQGDISWKQAERWVRYTFPDTLQKRYDNWRLPTLEELRSLYMKKDDAAGYDTDCGQRVWITPVIRLSCGWVWASEKKSITANVFNFHRGYHYTDRMVRNRAYRALPVRSLK